MKEILVVGGGTFSRVACHLSIAAPAFGTTAKALHDKINATGKVKSRLILTKLADSSSDIITNGDVEFAIRQALHDSNIRAVIMNAALCDFRMDNPSNEGRLSSQNNYDAKLIGDTRKVIAELKAHYPDVIFVGFKTTHGDDHLTQVKKVAKLRGHCDIVFGNDTLTRKNMLGIEEGVLVGERSDLLDRLVEELVNATS